MEVGERLSVLETKMDYTKNHVDNIESRVGSLETKTDRVLGELDTIKTFLIAPKEPFLGNVSKKVWKITKFGSILGALFVVGWFILEHVVRLIFGGI